MHRFMRWLFRRTTWTFEEMTETVKEVRKQEYKVGYDTGFFAGVEYGGKEAVKHLKYAIKERKDAVDASHHPG